MSVEWILSSCAVIVLVILIRFIFRRRIRPCVRYALWLAVALRLLLPFSFWGTAISVLNLLPERPGPLVEAEQEIMDREDAFAEEGQRQAEKAGQADQADTFLTMSGKEAEEKEETGLKVHQTVDGIPAALPEASAEGRKISWQSVLRWGWLLGAALLGTMILLTNLAYGRRLKSGRQKVTEERLPESRRCRLPVYTADIIEIPCLSGLFHPGIYVTEQVLADHKLLGFVLSHEGMHYRHHDNWWALVRTFCLCLHWYNPLVWAAVYLSGRDGELACDEKVLEGLDGRERNEYGRALLALSTGEAFGMDRWRISTAMGGGKRQLKERLKMIVNTPEKSTGMQLVLSALAVVVLVITFTGKNDQVREVQADPVTDEEQQAEQPAVTLGHGEEDAKASPAPEDGQDILQTVLKPGQGSEAYDEEQLPAYQRILKGDEPYPSGEPIRADDVLAADLNFDGWKDLCIRGRSTDGLNIPYYCMLWNPRKQKFEYSVTLCNVETDPEGQWIISQVAGTAGESFVTYCRYDEDNILHMIRYVEDNKNGEGPEHLDLTYVEQDDMYTLSAIVDEERFNVTMVDMARQALWELYQWTGEKVGTACFQVSNMGNIVFSRTPEDMAHSRIFFSRSFGVDTRYNISGYDKSISSIGVVSGRDVWFSPVLWRVFPEDMENMTDEEVIRWYFERLPIGETEGIKTMEQRYPDMDDTWTLQTESGQWYEVFYNKELREISDVVGPYPELPQH